MQPVGIVGLGPVGTILGAYLVRSGVKVYGVEPSEGRAEQIRKDGFFVRGFTQIQEHPEAIVSSLGELSQIKDLIAVFLCTKTWAIRTVMADFMKYDWPDDMRIAAFMNGIGPEDEVGDYIGRERVCRGIVNYAGNVSDAGWVNMNWFHPPNQIGPATEREVTWSPEVVELLNNAGLETIQVDHHAMKREAFFKTILNSALNALCAAHGLTMSEAMRLKHTRRTARRLLREGLSVAGLVGYHYGEDTLDRCLKYLEGGGDHYPSMWFDLKNKNPTEIEYINGKIVKIGRMFNIMDVDVNQFFTSAIVTQEIKNGTRTEDEIPDYLVDN